MCTEERFLDHRDSWWGVWECVDVVKALDAVSGMPEHVSMALGTVEAALALVLADDVSIDAALNASWGLPVPVAALGVIYHAIEASGLVLSKIGAINEFSMDLQGSKAERVVVLGLAVNILADRLAGEELCG